MSAHSPVRWFWLLAFTSCSALVDPGSVTVKCEIVAGETDPCLPAGMHCVASVCKACKGEKELCNGVDDDCDGIVDNGQDEDGDGFTWCGGLVRELVDCAPSDPKIHPAGKPGPDGIAQPAPKEDCDGKDNDCDGMIDEAPECAAMPPCVQGSCKGNQFCDEKTGVCIEPGPVGNQCHVDSECAGGLCVGPNDFGLDVQLKDSRCASACCSDADCTSGSVCVVGSTGARLCLPANIAGRATAASGEGCGGGDDCASGVCYRGRCATRCVNDAGCRGGAACMLTGGGLADPRTWLCGDPSGREAPGTICVLDPTICRSNFCPADRSVCAKPCGRTADCGSDEECGINTVRPLFTFTPVSIASACEPRSNGGAADHLCCTNADCGETQLCAPKELDSRLSVMVCR